MKIQRLAAEEVTRFRAIRLRALRDSPLAFGTAYEDAVAWSIESWTSLFAGLVAFAACRGAHDIGMVRVAADLEVKGAARLGSLWVEPEARGTRVGGALVDAAVGWAREHGYSRILLDVANGNHAAIGLYENAGFLPTGRIMHFPAPREDLGKHERSKTL